MYPFLESCDALDEAFLSANFFSSLDLSVQLCEKWLICYLFPFLVRSNKFIGLRIANLERKLADMTQDTEPLNFQEMEDATLEERLEFVQALARRFAKPLLFLETKSEMLTTVLSRHICTTRKNKQYGALKSVMWEGSVILGNSKVSPHYTYPLYSERLDGHREYSEFFDRVQKFLNEADSGKKAIFKQFAYKAFRTTREGLRKMNGSESDFYFLSHLYAECMNTFDFELVSMKLDQVLYQAKRGEIDIYSHWGKEIDSNSCPWTSVPRHARRLETSLFEAFVEANENTNLVLARNKLLECLQETADLKERFHIPRQELRSIMMDRFHLDDLAEISTSCNLSDDYFVWCMYEFLKDEIAMNDRGEWLHTAAQWEQAMSVYLTEVTESVVATTKLMFLTLIQKRKWEDYWDREMQDITPNDLFSTHPEERDTHPENAGSFRKIPLFNQLTLDEKLRIFLVAKKVGQAVASVFEIVQVWDEMIKAESDLSKRLELIASFSGLDECADKGVDRVQGLFSSQVYLENIDWNLNNVEEFAEKFEDVQKRLERSFKNQKK